ncbi:hypothetical protein SmJEL517_g01157 [Synchytrium microbalum]|uniref:THO complex subunit 1 transcription elongation factor n=1 Tax=Synchytrium microbalum TaxID=1806994 RepID=A0A507CAX3_9FUNG|nr:uncharacterized protein SmJEL517_g01157 [Synchytrium microbalum]TPX36611.1 hypothetical protein SmJEL517_g01157 [Synchytrium microbalum]
METDGIPLALADNLLSQISGALEDTLLHSLAAPSPTRGPIDGLADNIKEFVPMYFASILVPPENISSDIVWKEVVSQALDVESRIKLHELIVLIQDQPEAVERARIFERVYGLLDIILECQEQGLAKDSAALQAVEDLVDALPIHLIDYVFDYLDSRYARIVTNINPKTGRGLTLLRLCNEALRRLEKTTHASTCGRILMFVAAVFSVTDKSGNNSQGKFNTDNVTYVEDQPYTMEVDGVRDDWDFYRQFWNIQKFFSNPPMIMEGDTFTTFKNDVDAILKEFENLERKDAPATPDRNRDSDSRKRKRDREHHESSEPPASTSTSTSSRSFTTDFFSPKYLTSHTLFDLELRDPNFRRQILLQHHIVLNFLASYGAKAKEIEFKYLAETPLQANARITALYTPTLNADQEQWISDAIKRVNKMLDRMKEKKTTITAKAIMMHEKSWTRWKLVSCPPYDENLKPDPLPVIRPTLYKKSFDPVPPVQKGNKKGIEARGKTTEIVLVENHLAKLNDAIDPLGEVKAGKRSEASNEMFIWRTLRLARRQVLAHIHGLKEGKDAGSPVAMLMHLRKMTPTLYGLPPNPTLPPEGNAATQDANADAEPEPNDGGADTESGLDEAEGGYSSKVVTDDMVVDNDVKPEEGGEGVAADGDDENGERSAKMLKVE